MDERLQIIRKNWNERTPVHAASEFYDVESFKSGRITLKEVELREIGDVSGKTLLHLQCHFGLDTMSWSRLGAKATGVDFSDTAIGLARQLNDETGTDVQFICSNIYDLPGVLDAEFDIVFTSYGVLCWLPDLEGWATVIDHFLRPGGTFYIVDGHPFMGVFEFSESGDMLPLHGYFHRELFFEGYEPSYTGSAELIKSPVYEWQHSLGDIVTALAKVGLSIEFLHEFPVSYHQAFPNMNQGDDGGWRFPEQNDSFPQLFSIRATK
jgi:SAM-dependent methyltransferase